MKHRRSQQLPSAKKAGHIQVNASQATAANTFVGRTETSLGFIGRAQAGPLSAKADGKPPALSPVSNGLRAKMIEADFMSCHVPLLRWTQLTPAKQAEKLPLTPSGARLSGAPIGGMSRMTESLPKTSRCDGRLSSGIRKDETMKYLVIGCVSLAVLGIGWVYVLRLIRRLAQARIRRQLRRATARIKHSLSG